MSGSGGQEPDAYGIRPLRPISRSPAIPAHGNGSQLREDDSKDLEILVLRHELRVLPRQRPGIQIDSQTLTSQRVSPTGSSKCANVDERCASS